MEYDVCALCKSTELAGNLTDHQLLVNSIINCGHKFHQNCFNRDLGRKLLIYCPFCNQPVKKSTLSDKSLDQIEVAKDAKIRRRINEIYNKIESDFPSHLDFCDYQEAMEDLIFGLVNEINVEAIEQQIAAYQKENAPLIYERQSKLHEENKKIEVLIEAEKLRLKTLHESFQESDLHEKQVRKEYKKETEEIMLGERDSRTVDLSTAKSGTEVNSALASGRPEAGFSRMMMGSVGDRAEGGGMDTGGPALPVPVPGIVVNTPLMMLLARRELPKPMMRASTEAHIQNRAAEVDRAHSWKVKTAGGYDDNVRFRRNWKELVDGLAQFQLDSAMWTHDWDSELRQLA